MPVHRYDLVIDGYNLMHASGHAPARSGPGDWQRSRERFLLWAWKRIPDSLRERTIIVFDAGETDNRYIGLSTFRELRLLYSPQGLEADDVIEDLIASHSAPKRLQVVSSDHRLHKAARARKATCLDSEVFVSTLARAQRKQREARRQQEAEAKPQADLPDQIDEWLRIFADVQPLADKERLDTPSTQRSGSRRSPKSAAPSSGSTEPSPSASPPPSPSVPTDELAFWEERLRDLLSLPPAAPPPGPSRR